MALEKFEYPASGNVTDSWLPTANPIFPEFVNGRDLGIAVEVSAGNKHYAYGAALHSTFFQRVYQNVNESDRAAFENFCSVAGGDYFKFTDERGVPHKVKFAAFAPTWKDAFNDNWSFAFTMRGEMAAPPSLARVPAGLRRDLLFYAPLVADLGAFGRWDVTPTSTLSPLTFAANGVLFDGGDGLSYLENGHALPAQGTIIFACDVTATSGGADAYQFVDAAVLAGSTGFEIVSDANAVRARVFSGGSAVASLTGGAVFVNNTKKTVGLAWQANDFRLVVDGVQVANDTSGAAPTALHGTGIFLGQRSDGSRKLQGHLKDVMIFVRALTSAEIISIQAGL